VNVERKLIAELLEAQDALTAPLRMSGVVSPESPGGQCTAVLSDGTPVDRYAYAKQVRDRARAFLGLDPEPTGGAPSGALPLNHGGECPGCRRIMSKREAAEQGMCNDCQGGAC